MEKRIVYQVITRCSMDQRDGVTRIIVGPEPTMAPEKFECCDFECRGEHLPRSMNGAHLGELFVIVDDPKNIYDLLNEKNVVEVKRLGNVYAPPSAPPRDPFHEFAEQHAEQFQEATALRAKEANLARIMVWIQQAGLLDDFVAFVRAWRADLTY